MWFKFKNKQGKYGTIDFTKAFAPTLRSNSFHKGNKPINSQEKTDLIYQRVKWH